MTSEQPTDPADILAAFRDEARRRGALAPGEAVSMQTAFRVVRDMPWAEASDLRPETAIAEWRGTGREKHLLLGAILAALGYEVGLIAVTHEFSAQSTPWLPPHLLDETRDAAVPDVQVLLRVQTNQVTDEWATIDASWPLSTRDLGLPVNEQLVTGVDQRIACDPIEMFHLASNHDHDDDDPGPGADPGEDDDDDEETPTNAETVALILRDHVGDAPGTWERRARFVDALTSWLAGAGGPR